MKRIIIMMLTSIFLKKMYQQKKIQLLEGLNSWPHPYHPCSDPLHHCVASATECNCWLILVICPALTFFLRENFLSSHDHGGRWSNRTYVALALHSLLSTCVVFWSHRRRDIVYTAVMFSPERMYITLDSSACTSHPSLKRYKCIWRFGKVTVLHQLS
jgi:hypothetical protein